MNRNAYFAAVATMLAFASGVPSAAESVAERPGIDRPIRVGMFKGGAPYLNHTNMHTAQSVVGSILANPAGANLGDSLVIPPAGFSFYAMPVALNNAGTAECSGGGCGPTQEQLDTIVAALDTLDVLIMNSNTNIGSRITNPAHRQAFETFWATKGFVSVHATTDSWGNWPALDSVNGTTFRGHPAEQDGQIVIDTTFQHEASWRFLNRGLYSNGTDTTFFEEWFFFTNTGAEIRARPHLRPTMTLNEATLANPGSQAPMGDHPMSWYREFPTGGRFFYTALGHRSQVWQTTRTFRRQLYNAILWAASHDSAATASIAQHRSTTSSPNLARLTLSGPSLIVSVHQDGPHTIGLLLPNGQRIETRHGSIRQDQVFKDLRSGVYVVHVNTTAGRMSKLVTVP